jgi:hypothetical protein
MWNKIAAVAITATVLGLAAPASAQMYGGGWWGGPYHSYSYGGGWWGGPNRHYYNYYPRRHFLFAPRHHYYRSWWGGY